MTKPKPGDIIKQFACPSCGIAIRIEHSDDGDIGLAAFRKLKEGTTVLDEVRVFMEAPPSKPQFCGLRPEMQRVLQKYADHLDAPALTQFAMEIWQVAYTEGKKDIRADPPCGCTQCDGCGEWRSGNWCEDCGVTLY